MENRNVLDEREREGERQKNRGINEDAECAGGMEMKGKGGKVREGCKTSDVKRRGGGQMREGSSRAEKGCEAKERANRGPCFTNCHLRGANGGMRGEKHNVHRLAPDRTQREMYSGTAKHCIMHMWVNTHTETQVRRKHRCTQRIFDG